jgi:hypothetical protein
VQFAFRCFFGGVNGGVGVHVEVSMAVSVPMG